MTTWISTVIIANNRILAELEGYMKVQDYFYGLNDRGMKMQLSKILNNKKTIYWSKKKI